MKQYQIIQERATAKEDENRFTSIVKDPTYCSHQRIERQATKLYNKDIFVKFQTELYNSSALFIDELIKDNKYAIVKNSYYKDAEFYKKRFHIEVDRIK
jgi:hypothetical protein